MNDFHKQLARNFDKATTTYFKHAYVQSNPATKLIQQLQLVAGNSDLILDLGCGPGTFRHLPVACKSQVINFDLSRQMLEAGMPEIPKVCGNAAMLPFAYNSFNYIISNLMLQWAPDKEKVLQEVQQILTDNGYLLFTTLVNPSLWQLQNAWQKLDSFRHNLQFNPATDYYHLCENTGFEIIHSHEWEEKYSYENIHQLLKHFKLSGTSLPQKSAATGLRGRHYLKQLENYYPEQSATNELLLSYCYLLVVARKHK